MSLDTEEMARREALLMANPDEVMVKVKVYWDGNICLPHPEGEEEEEAIFGVLTYGDHAMIEQACRHETEREDGKKQTEVDFNELRRLTLKRNLLSWSLNVPIERRNGWLTPESYKRIGKVSAPLLEAFLDGYWIHSDVTKDEEAVIDKQSAILFGKNSRGVADACEAVRLYCNMTSQWDKFGLKEAELSTMSYRKYMMLKMMTNNENEAMRRESKAKNTPVTRIAGGKGGTRISRGQRIPG
jgi:hypothetical protein